MSPRTIGGKYQIVQELGHGGMGAVYEARHMLTGRRVALKLILSDRLAGGRESDARRRFEREARAGGSIESRHVAAVLDTGIDGETSHHFIVMEFLSGEDLRALLRRTGRLSPDLVLRIAAQVCRGLHRAHGRGIIHRDIKAGNIFLARRDGGEVEVKVLDFGIAKLKSDPLSGTEQHDLTRSDSVLGSPLYMSPEQATGSRHLDPRTDIWSLGVVMYEALSGVTPHGQQPLGSLILAICSTPAAPIHERAPWVPREVGALVHKALALEPGQRFESAEEMRQAIGALIHGETVIHESMLDAVSGSHVERATDTAPAVTPGSGSKARGQTTTDAFSIRSGSGEERSASARLGRMGRAMLVAGSLGLLGAFAALRYAPEPPLDTPAAESAIAAVSAPPLPPAAAAPARRAAESPARAHEPGSPDAGTMADAVVPSPADSPSSPSTRQTPAAHGMPPPRTARAARTPPAALAPPASVVTVPPPPAAPLPSAREPTIDRSFD